MNDSTPSSVPVAKPIVKYFGEVPRFSPGQQVRVSVRYPVGHYRVPHYIRGKRGVIDVILTPPAVNNEEEGFGRNAGDKRFYYRVAIELAELWPGYRGTAADKIVIEVFEDWLEAINP